MTHLMDAAVDEGDGREVLLLRRLAVHVDGEAGVVAGSLGRCGTGSSGRYCITKQMRGEMNVQQEL